MIFGKEKNIFKKAGLAAVVFCLPLVFGGKVLAAGDEVEKQINAQSLELKEEVLQLEQVRGKEKNSVNIGNEKAIRQGALFKVIEISLLENRRLVEAILYLKDEYLARETSDAILRSLEEDNKKYRELMDRVNLAVSPDELKEIAREIKERRQSREGLSLRRVLGLVFSLRELKLIEEEKKRLEDFYRILPEQSAENNFGSLLEQAGGDLDEAYQLTKSGQLRLEKMDNFEDFLLVNDWLKRANDSILKAGEILNSLAGNISGGQ